MDELFSAELFFYKKGMPYYITAKGLATRSPLQLSGNLHKTMIPGENMIVVQMDSYEFIELNKKTDHGILSIAASLFSAIW